MNDFGPYRIVRMLAVGGMAEIYLARQQAMEGVERQVVLKRIRPAFSSNDEFVTMFLDEARLLAALSHPNIAQVFDLGRVDESYYLVMEYVRGPTLGALLAASSRSGRRGLPEKQALGIALTIAEALSYVHERRDDLGRPLNIVHRDLNPANVIVSYDGAVKLIDFGIAKAATKVYETRTGVIKGTYGYIAPEQLTRAAPVDHRADVFALGVLLYEMCLGSHPFDASDEPSLIDRILGAKYKRPRQLVPDFPAALDRLIARCLTPHPEGRPETVHVLIEELTTFMGHRGIVCTMGDVATLTRALVPDAEGPVPLKPLHPPPTRKPWGADRTQRLPSQRPLAPDSPPPPLPRTPPDSTLEIPKGAHAHDAIAKAPPPPVFDEPSVVARPKATFWHRVLVTGASLIIIVGVGVIAFVTTRAIGTSVTRPKPAAATPPGSSRDAEAQEPGKTSSPRRRTPAIRVVSEPQGAIVAIDGVEMSRRTPLTVPMPANGDKVWVRVSLPGYIPQERAVAAAVGEARFVLVPIALGSQPSP